ncbi:hypothetical protein OUZ56_002382 [Daphnia magna]|uniref:Carboxylesterase 4A n=1 Tax=Daphnia magna TaxID=35525 RepID=A0A0P5IY14_9CRUS|nr:hypothetical protein OUZ56_002382 [Daphnia magna]
MGRWMHFWMAGLFFWMSASLAQDPSVVLPQGEIRGVKKPSNKRSTVVAFLGIPYAQPPVGPLRFRMPEEIQPSNKAIIATQFGPACPQPDMDRLKTSEDCLFVNVWVPELPVDLSVKTYPVIVFLEGEMFIQGNPGKYPAEDLAAEGLVVVSVHYRLGIFGFLSLESPETPGNMGLWDQHMALKWVQKNIGKFGGDPSRVTLMGHGSGAASVSMHMVSPTSKGLFERVIVMSGSLFAPWAISHYPKDAAQAVAYLLGCRSHRVDEHLLHCLREREVPDILQAFSRHQKDLNTTELFGPVVDSFAPMESAFFGKNPQATLQKGDFDKKMRVMTGVAESEGAGMLSMIRNLARRTYDDLVHLVRTASIPRAVDFYGFRTAWQAVYRTIRYHYFDKVADKDKAGMLQQLLQFYSEAYYKAPHDHFVTGLVRNNVPTYIYRYAHATSDPFNNVLNTTGAPHGSELLYLFGPTVYRQEIGVGFSRQDEAVSDLMKRAWLEFASLGDPTPSQFGFKWEPSTKDELKNYEIREQLARVPYPRHKVEFWNEFLPSLERAARGEEDVANPTNRPPFDSRFRGDPTQPYQSIMWVLIAAISVLLVAFILSLASMRRKTPLV